MHTALLVYQFRERCQPFHLTAMACQKSPGELFCYFIRIVALGIVFTALVLVVKDIVQGRKHDSEISKIQTAIKSIDFAGMFRSAMPTNRVANNTIGPKTKRNAFWILQVKLDSILILINFWLEIVMINSVILI